MASRIGTTDSGPLRSLDPDVIEIALLLPSSRMQALLDLSKDRGQSVGKILRDLIERELAVGQVGC